MFNHTANSQSRRGTETSGRLFVETLHSEETFTQVEKRKKGALGALRRLSFRLEDTIKLLNVCLKKNKKQLRVNQLNVLKDELIKLIPIFNLKEESEVLHW